VSLEAFYDYTERREAVAGETRHAVALEFQHRRPIARRHDRVWGVDLRSTGDRVTGGEALQISRARETDTFTSVYANGEIAPASGQVALTLGARLAHSSFTGFEVEPGVRVLWQARPRQALGAAIWPAVRTPSRTERGARGYVESGSLPDGTPFVGLLVGNPDLLPETLVAYTSALHFVAVPSYSRFDARLGWRGAGPIELSVAAQNLVGPRHLEFDRTFNAHPAPVGRTFNTKATWRF
jgi:iron complex outermembrane receptor protein